MVKNPPCNAGDTGSIPGWGTKIPHATEQLSTCTTSRELVRCDERSYKTCQSSLRSQLRPDTAKQKWGCRGGVWVFIFPCWHFPRLSQVWVSRHYGKPGIHTRLSSDMRGIEVFAVSWTLGSPSSKDSEQWKVSEPKESMGSFVPKIRLMSIITNCTPNCLDKRDKADLGKCQQGQNLEWDVHVSQAGGGEECGGGSVAQSCPTLCSPMDCSLPLHCPWDFPGKNTGLGCHFLLQGTLLGQGLNSQLLRGRRILCHWAKSCCKSGFLSSVQCYIYATETLSDLEWCKPWLLNTMSSKSPRVLGNIPSDSLKLSADRDFPKAPPLQN